MTTCISLDMIAPGVQMMMALAAVNEHPVESMIASHMTVQGGDEDIFPLFIDNMLVVLLGSFLVNVVVFAGLSCVSE
jgi:hypothetical protein